MYVNPDLQGLKSWLSRFAIYVALLRFTNSNLQQYITAWQRMRENFDHFALPDLWKKAIYNTIF